MHSMRGGIDDGMGSEGGDEVERWQALLIYDWHD